MTIDRETILPAKRGDPAARQWICSYMGAIVGKIVANLVGDGRHLRIVERDDLIQVGFLGVLQAIDSFDETRSPSFVKHASLCVRWAILAELRRHKAASHSPLPSSEIESDYTNYDLDELPLECLIEEKRILLLQSFAQTDDCRRVSPWRDDVLNVEVEPRRLKRVPQKIVEHLAAAA